MSIDKQITDLLAGVASLEAALTKNTSYLERVVAGQEAAMAKLEGTKAPTTRASKTTAAAPAAETPKAADPAPVTPKAADPAPVAASTLTQEDIKALAMKWRASTEDEAARKKQHEFLTSVMSELGVTKLTGPEGPTDPMDIKKAVFWIDRKMAGHKVDFNAEYDFDGSPEQGVAAPAAAADEMFG